MRRLIVLLSCVVMTVSLSAQSRTEPSAGQLRESLRELSPAVRDFRAAVLAELAALGFVNKAMSELRSSTSLIAIDRALSVLDDARAAAMPEGRPTPALVHVERMISELKTRRLNWDPAGFPAMLDTLHHESVHPLQKLALDELQGVASAIQELHGLEQSLISAQTAIAGSAAAAVREGSR